MISTCDRDNLYQKIYKFLIKINKILGVDSDE